MWVGGNADRSAVRAALAGGGTTELTRLVRRRTLCFAYKLEAQPLPGALDHLLRAGVSLAPAENATSVVNWRGFLHAILRTAQAGT